MKGGKIDEQSKRREVNWCSQKRRCDESRESDKEEKMKQFRILVTLYLPREFSTVLKFQFFPSSLVQTKLTQ